MSRESRRPRPELAAACIAAAILVTMASVETSAALGAPVGDVLRGGQATGTPPGSSRVGADGLADAVSSHRVERSLFRTATGVLAITFAPPASRARAAPAPRETFGSGR
ncbi:MAG: hypothetical protein R2878_12945 [Thermoleophilia bacterium]